MRNIDVVTPEALQGLIPAERLATVVYDLLRQKRGWYLGDYDDDTLATRDICPEATQETTGFLHGLRVPRVMSECHDLAPAVQAGHFFTVIESIPCEPDEDIVVCTTYRQFLPKTLPVPNALIARRRDAVAFLSMLSHTASRLFEIDTLVERIPPDVVIREPWRS